MIIQSASLSVVERRKPALGVSEMLAVDWISSTIKLWRIILRTFLVQLLNLPKALPSVNNPLQLLQNIFGLRQKPTKLLDWVQPELLSAQVNSSSNSSTVLSMSGQWLCSAPQPIVRAAPDCDQTHSWHRHLAELLGSEAINFGRQLLRPLPSPASLWWPLSWSFRSFKPLSIFCEPASHNTMSSCWS